jgi:hypothetical protein
LLFLAAIKHSVKLLFGFNFQICGALSSDHSHALANAFTVSFPTIKKVQDFAHIIHKFKIKDRKENGAYLKQYGMSRYQASIPPQSCYDSISSHGSPTQRKTCNYIGSGAHGFSGKHGNVRSIHHGSKMS